jgi:DNA-binding beta-propeller fold protein YncE
VIYVSNFGAHSVTVFAPRARGNVAPIRTIAGANTCLSGPLGLAVDAQNNLYVANRTAVGVVVYAPTADGNVAPLRNLCVPEMSEALAVAIGPKEDVFVSTSPRHGSDCGATAILHFPFEVAESDYAIAGPLTGLTYPVGLAVDRDGTIYVANAFGGVVSAFAAGAVGNALPMRSFSAATSSTQGIACGAKTLLLTGPGVYLYPSAITPVARPAAIFARSASLPLEYPGGITIDTGGAAPILYVADYAAHAVHVIHTAGVPPRLAVMWTSAIKGPATRAGRAGWRALCA